MPFIRLQPFGLPLHSQKKRPMQTTEYGKTVFKLEMVPRSDTNIATKMHILIHKENKKYKEVMMQTTKIKFECWMTFLFFSPF